MGCAESFKKITGLIAKVKERDGSESYASIEALRKQDELTPRNLVLGDYRRPINVPKEIETFHRDFVDPSAGSLKNAISQILTWNSPRPATPIHHAIQLMEATPEHEVP